MGALFVQGLWAASPDVSAVPNFHKINEQVYRGAQPSPQGFQNLARLGIKVVLDLREPGSRSDNERAVVQAAGMKYVSMPFRGFGAPTAEQMAQALSLLAANDGPVFVHCRRGADRTGTVIACYRISHDHWQGTKALEEAKSCGMSWMERAMQRYVLSYAPATVTDTAVATAAQ